MAAILATLDDVNANLSEVLQVANESEIDLLQVSVARVVRGYLSRVIDNATLQSWTDPSVTPDIIKEVAAKFIAAQWYFNNISSQSAEISETGFAQRKYNEGMTLLNNIINGDIEIPAVDVTSTDDMSTLDYFPIDDTDRAFTRGMQL